MGYRSLRASVVVWGALLAGCAVTNALDPHRIGIVDFESWEGSDDGFLDNYEWDLHFPESGIIEVWDRDSDLHVDRDEWLIGPVDWYAENVGYWYDWDWNGDQSLDAREFGNVLFEAWDDDENVRIDAGEFEQGVDAL
jgi:hypothetical protein